MYDMYGHMYAMEIEVLSYLDNHANIFIIVYAGCVVIN